jgi:hypothetical protein
MKVLCIIPTLLTDLNPDCVPALEKQTVPIDRIIVSSVPMRGGTLAGRVSVVLNRAIQGIDLSKYDYLFRVDCDTILKPTYLETALQGNPDLAANGGYCMLIKTKPFIELANGRFHPVSDDSYIIHKFKISGKHVKPTNDDLLDTRMHKHAKKDSMFVGCIYQKVGWEPLHVWFLLLDKYRKKHGRFAQSGDLGYNVWWIIAGYTLAFFKHETKFEFANQIWNYQVRRLLPVLNMKLKE